LSIDVEGLELQVLKGFDIKKYEPDLIILEFLQPEIKEISQQNISRLLESEIYKYMINKEYKLINWIHADLVFVKDYDN